MADRNAIETGLEDGAVAFLVGLQRLRGRGQPFFRRFDLGDIPRDGYDAGSAVNLNGRCRYEPREYLAVLPSKPGLEIPAIGVLAQRLDKILPIARICPDVEFPRRSPNDFFALEPQDIEVCVIGIDICPIVQTVDID